MPIVRQISVDTTNTRHSEIVRPRLAWPIPVGIPRIASLLPFLVLGMTALLASPTLAQDETEWAVDNGNWFVVDNWADGLPDADTDAVIGNDGTAAVDADGAEAREARVDSGTLEVVADGILSSSLGRVGDLAGATGQAAVSGPDARWLVDSGINTTDLSVGEEGTGTLRIEDGGRVTSTNLGIGGNDGEVVLSGDGTQLDNELDISIGRLGGTGVLAVTDGARVVNGRSGRLGFGSGIGSVTISGADSEWINDGEMRVGEGEQSSGALTIESGGLVDSGQGRIIGRDAGSSGTVTVTGSDSTWLSGGSDLIIGEAGSGSLAIEAGGTVESAAATVADTEEAQGDVTVSGTNSAWTPDSVTIGDAGTGTVTVDAGASVANASNSIGLRSGSQGSLTVSGAGSEWASIGGARIGFNGTGELNVFDGGGVDHQARVIIGGGVGSGGGASGEGSVEIAGDGSEWTIEGKRLFVGASGDGSVHIAEGGTLIAPETRIGNRDGAEGELTVTGSQSLLQVDDSITVGRSGTGQLIIDDGGTVTGQSGGAIGAQEGGNGTVSVAGSGSNWALDGELLVGGPGGNGTMAIAAGGTVSNNGIADIGLDGEGSVTISGNGSEWNMDGSGLFIGDAGVGSLVVEDAGIASGIGNVSLSGADSEIRIGTGNAPGTLDADLIGVGSGARLVFDHNEDAHEFTPGLGGPGDIRAEAGRTVLDGDGTQFTGTTTIDGGTLRIDNQLGGTIEIEPGGRLEGAGTVGSTEAAGTIAPGDSIGALDVDGDLTLDPGAIVEFELDASPEGDRIGVDGDLTLDGTASITDLGGLEDGVYTLFSHTGELTDNGIEVSGLPEEFQATVDATSEPGEVRLVVQGDPEAAVPIPVLSRPAGLVMIALVVLLGARFLSARSTA